MVKLIQRFSCVTISGKKHLGGWLMYTPTYADDWGYACLSAGGFIFYSVWENVGHHHSDGGWDWSISSLLPALQTQVSGRTHTCPHMAHMRSQVHTRHTCMCTHADLGTKSITTLSEWQLRCRNESNAWLLLQLSSTVNLTQPRIFWEKDLSSDSRLIGLWAYTRLIVLVVNWCKRDKPIVGSTIP